MCGYWSVMALCRGLIHCVWHVLSYILLRRDETFASPVQFEKLEQQFHTSWPCLFPGCAGAAGRPDCFAKGVICFRNATSTSAISSTRARWPVLGEVK